MVQIRDRMGELVKGIFRIKTKDETEFELRPKEGIKSRLLFNYKIMQETNQRYGELVKKDKATEDYIKAYELRSKQLLDEQNDCMRDILKASYPEFTDDQISAIMVQYGDELLQEIYMAFGWIDKDVIEALKKKKLEEIKKLSGEEGQPHETKPQENEPKN